MLERLSWSTYWSVVSIVLAIYFLVLILLLYRKGFFNRKPKQVQPGTATLATQNPPEEKYVEKFAPAPQRADVDTSRQLAGDNIHMPLVHDLIEEIKSFIVGIAESSYIKEEVIQGIQVIVQNYTALQSTSYYKSINDYIRYECESNCAINLSEDDIRRIWIG